MGLLSTTVGDEVGIGGGVCFFFCFFLLYMEKLLSTDERVRRETLFFLPGFLGTQDRLPRNEHLCVFSHLWPEAAFLSSRARESAARRDLSSKRASAARTQTSRGSEDEDATRRCEVPGGPAVPRAGDEAALAFA